MASRLIIEPEAERDLEEAFQWYEKQRVGLGREFLASVERIFDRICEMPESSALADGKARLTPMKRFPYAVCHLFEGDTVYIVAVFHQRRDPRSWQDRIS